MSDKKILGYINEDSIVTEEQVKILTHIHVAFGRLTMEGTISFKNHPFLKQLPQIRKWNPENKSHSVSDRGRTGSVYRVQRIRKPAGEGVRILQKFGGRGGI